MKDSQRKAMFAKMARPQASSYNVPYAPYKNPSRGKEIVGIDAKGREQVVTKKDFHKALIPIKENVDEAQASEIKIFMDNDGDLYRQQTMPIAKNLQKKFDKGTYDKDKATKAWYNSVTSWERTHRADVGTANKDTRIQVARELESEYRAEFESGNRF